MALVALAFLLGGMIVHAAPSVASDPHVLLLAVLAGWFATRRATWPLAALVFAVGWTMCNATARLAEQVDARWEGQDVQVTGSVDSVPIHRDRATRFTFKIDELMRSGVRQAAPRLAVLTWYAPDVTLPAGSRWRLTVRLKQPHGFANPGGFDYEAWLFANGIRATGYVRADPAPELLPATPTLRSRIAALRQTLIDRIHSAVTNHSQAAVLAALVAGDQHAITSQQWDIMLATGTNHLISISGLHVALVAGLVFGVTRRLVGWSSVLRGMGPALFPAAIAAVCAAMAYAALAGFAVPTQRALIMVVVVMLAKMWRRHIATSHALWASLLLVLAWDPFASLSASFWLSFALVAAIFYCISGRRSARGVWHRFVRMHVLLALIALPLVLFFFNQVSWLSPLANALAVPWVGLIVVPLALLGSALQFINSTCGGWLLQGAAWHWQGVEWCLTQLVKMPGSVWFTATPPWWVNMSALAGLACCLLPRATPGRWLGVLGCLPLLLWRPELPAWGQAWFTLLDVGQGLSAVVRTRSHVMVYDTGPRFNDTFDTGSAVVLPFLRHQGIPSIDTLVIGHADNDHAGGADSVLSGMPVHAILTSAPTLFPAGKVELCADGQRWDWDGVSFEVLHPALGQSARENNLSCVLQVTAGPHTVLLTGDIEREAEQQLVGRYAKRLVSDVLVAPHHGSATSSTALFLDAVQPSWVAFPVGYRNRFGFPAPKVVARYRARQAQLVDSVRHGAIEWRLGTENGLEYFSFRNANRHYWQREQSE